MQKKAPYLSTFLSNSTTFGLFDAENTSEGFVGLLTLGFYFVSSKKLCYV